MNPNKSNRPLIVSLVVFVIVLLIVIIFLLLRKPTDVSFIENNETVPVVMNQQDDSKPVVKSTVTTSLPATQKYEDTPESKVVSEQSPTYLVGIEKRSDGYYYASLDYVRFDSSKPGPMAVINDNSKIRTFRVSPNVKIGYEFTNQVPQTGDKFYQLNDYVNLIQKQGNRYVNPTVQNSSFKHNGLYEVVIQNGMVVGLYEGGDFTEAQGT
jgi:hypothetical protein